MSKVVAPRDTKPDSGKELTESNLLTEIWRKKSADCSFSSRQAQNMLGSGIWAGDLRSRSLHVDLHVELHHVENSPPADSATCFPGLARISFSRRDPSPKNLKSSWLPRHKTALPESPLGVEDCKSADRQQA